MRISPVALGCLAVGFLCVGPSLVHARPGMHELTRHLTDSDRLVGDPGGARSWLERRGVDLRLFYNQYLSGKPSGGGRNPAGVFGYSGSYDFFAQLDADALVGWPGGEVMLQVKGQYDRNLNAAVGALSDPIDDADFDEPIYVNQLWVQQAAFDGRLRVRAGFTEQQTVFDRNAYANSEDRQFLASFLDNNAVVPLPDGFSALALVTPTSWLALAVGVADADNRPRRAGFDTAFDGVDSLSAYFEASLRGPWEEGGRPGAYRLGLFVDGRQRLDFWTRRLERGHVGFYASFDQLLWRPDGDGFRGLGLFARFGYADADVNRIAWFWSAGFEWVGPLAFRRFDVLGFGTYQAIGSSAYQATVDPRFERETGIEIYYAMRALGWLVVTPDLQVIVDPGATGAVADAVVGTLRLRVIF